MIELIVSTSYPLSSVSVSVSVFISQISMWEVEAASLTCMAIHLDHGVCTVQEITVDQMFILLKLDGLSMA